MDNKELEVKAALAKVTGITDEAKINDLFNMAKDLQTLHQWKAYPEHEPEPFTWVLATLKSPEQTWVEIVAYLEDSWDLPGRGKTEFVTHWMPIPKAAK